MDLFNSFGEGGNGHNSSSMDQRSGLGAHGLAPLEIGVLDQNSLIVEIQRQLSKEDPRALVSIKHTYLEELQALSPI